MTKDLKVNAGDITRSILVEERKTYESMVFRVTNLNVFHLNFGVLRVGSDKGCPERVPAGAEAYQGPNYNVKEPK